MGNLGIDRETFPPGKRLRFFCIYLDVQILLGTYRHSPLLPDTYLFVDTTLCPVEMSRFDWALQKEYWSVKHKEHGYKYEIAINARVGTIHWISGPHRGAMSDITIIRHSGLLRMLEPGEHIIRDLGYQGEPLLLLTPSPHDPRIHLRPIHHVWNTLIHSERALIENVNARLKRFACLSVPWRHDLRRHHIAFNICANITALDVRLYPLRAVD